MKKSALYFLTLLLGMTFSFLSTSVQAQTDCYEQNQNGTAICASLPNTNITECYAKAQCFRSIERLFCNCQYFPNGVILSPLFQCLDDADLYYILALGACDLAFPSSQDPDCGSRDGINTHH